VTGITTIDGDEATTTFTRLAQQLDLTLVDTVNWAALQLTTDARHGYKAALGPEQRLSGYWYTPKGTRVAGGRRLNPAYKEASSVTKPVALVMVRGPAQLIENPRKGGYRVKGHAPRARKISDAAVAMAERQGLSRAAALRAARAATTRPIRTPDGPRAGASPGPIRRPLAPFRYMMLRAASIIDRGVTEQVERDVQRRLQHLQSGIRAVARVVG
jgi:hypothetical protein